MLWPVRGRVRRRLRLPAFGSARCRDSLQCDGPASAQAGDVVGIFDCHSKGDDGRAVLAGPGGPHRCGGKHEPAAAVLPDLLRGNWEPDHADQVSSGQTVGRIGASRSCVRPSLRDERVRRVEEGRLGIEGAFLLPGRAACHAVGPGGRWTPWHAERAGAAAGRGPRGRPPCRPRRPQRGTLGILQSRTRSLRRHWYRWIIVSGMTKS